MKKFLSLTFPVIFFSGFFLSCSREINPASRDEGLAGTWMWVRSNGGLSYSVQTPASTGDHIDMELQADGKYTIHKNNSVSSEGTYSTRIQRCIHDHKDKPYISFSNDQGLMIERITTDSLYVSDEFFDGYNRVYIRKDLVYPY